MRRIFCSLLLLALLSACAAPQNDVRARISAIEQLQDGDTSGFLRASQPREFVFPQDHGPHPGFRTEWWYYTGNLRSAEGRHFGFQLTFFRSTLAPSPPERESAWASSEVYMAHFALADVASGQFYAFDRFGRGAAQIAGAQAAPFRVWLEDWEALEAGTLDQYGTPPMQLRAAQAGIAIDLRLASSKPPALQGEAGLSQKGPEPGNASYYYSLTRMLTEGSIRIGEQRFDVRGLSWMDREWSTSALSEGLQGWDWFSIQLDDGRDLMYYQLRRNDGSADRFSKGALIDAEGNLRVLRAEDVQLQVLGRWESPNRVEYPSGWRLSIPAAGLELELQPYLQNQELNLATLYWEGAVRISGSATGNGYVELTGYGDE